MTLNEMVLLGDVYENKRQKNVKRAGQYLRISSLTLIACSRALQESRNYHLA